MGMWHHKPEAWSWLMNKITGTNKNKKTDRLMTWSLVDWVDTMKYTQYKKLKKILREKISKSPG